MKLVIKWDAEAKAEMGINADGTISTPEQAEQFSADVAAQVATQFGGTVVDESRYFGDDE